MSNHCEDANEHKYIKNETCPTCSLEVDQYGNTEEDFLHCSYGDCGCDGSRNCMAPSGANHGSMSLNFEKGSFSKEVQS